MLHAFLVALHVAASDESRVTRNDPANLESEAWEESYWVESPEVL